jgi:hypothetical protein
MMRVLIVAVLFVVYASSHMYNAPSYYIRQNLNLLGGWSSANISDPTVIKISQWVVNHTFHHPYEYEILFVKTQVVAGINYDLLLKTYLNSSSSSYVTLSTNLPRLLYNYATNRLQFDDLFDSISSLSLSPCWSKDRFLVWDHFGNLTITNHTEISRACQK